MGNCSSSSFVQGPSKVAVRSENQDQNETTIDMNAFLEQATREFDMKYAEPSLITAKIEDFQLQRTIGMGSFARVMLVKHGNQSLALKIMEKQSIVELNQAKQILSEKRILQSINSPFLVSLKYAFKDNACLYLALEYVSGGDMFGNFRKVRKYSEDQACFYAAQIVLALEYLHDLNIVFRNVKPEDILFAADGYLKLTDFGFAKVVEGRTHTLCGTPEYLAPEIVTGIGHHKGVDYWALGILIYEMTTGSTPFRAEDPMQSFRKIMRGTFEIPDYLSSNLADLISKFLELRPYDRYGCLENGTKDIKSHKWFSSINWIAIAEKRLQAPFIPKDGEDYYDQYDEKPLISAETDLYSTEFDSF